jgi:predicted enzyme related to lactoylglutathione lyase
MPAGYVQRPLDRNALRRREDTRSSDTQARRTIAFDQPQRLDGAAVEAYFQRPDAENPAYVEFRIGGDEDEFGIIDRRYAPATMQPGPGGATLLWHVDDIEAAFARLKAMGATEYDPITKRESDFVTASVVDPFGNVLGIMYNPHYVEMLKSRTA